jgi:hypothetical protein
MARRGTLKRVTSAWGRPGTKKLKRAASKAERASIKQTLFKEDR